MEITGHVNNGVVVLDGNSHLPEGAAVRVVYLPDSCHSAEQTTGEYGTNLQIVAEYDEQGELKFPLIRTGQLGTLQLNNQLIAELLDEEDAAAGR